jgi:GT2 family glycosyltransferase
VSWGCILLTTGNKPAELALAVESLQRQTVAPDIVVVGNGWDPGELGVYLPVDEGIPAGRNAGVPHVSGDLLFFLDDDAQLRDDDALERVQALFAGDPALGMVQLRVDPSNPPAVPLRDWCPRVRIGDRTRSSEITVVWEGAVAIRRSVFDRVGGWPVPFRFVHEGVDLGWRVMDAGFRVWYAGDIVALHPVTGAKPHPYYHYHGARNRVWLARIHLPWVVGSLYVGLFMLRSFPRYRHSRFAFSEVMRGYREGLRGPAPPRRPLKWSTLYRMTRAGRPPLL